MRSLCSGFPPVCISRAGHSGLRFLQGFLAAASALQSKYLLLTSPSSVCPPSPPPSCPPSSPRLVPEEAPEEPEEEAAGEAPVAEEVQRAFLPAPQRRLPPERAAALEEERRRLQVSVENAGDAVYPLIGTFEELGVLPSYVLDALAEMNVQAPMPIQAQALPIILGGEDLIGIARTGSGKTLAFLLPALVHVEAQEPPQRHEATPIALVLAPTRELVAQIAEEAGKLCEHSAQGRHPGGIWAECVYGGKQRAEQLRTGGGPSSQPRRGGSQTSCRPATCPSPPVGRTTYFVLDEADRMLDCGFQADVQGIAGQIRPDRHMLFFSATWPQAVQDLASSFCLDGREPVTLRVGQGEQGEAATRPDIVQEVVVFDQEAWEERDAAKKELLHSHLRETLQEESSKVLVFVNNKAFADELRDTLCGEGFLTDSMHGGRKQWDRDEVLAKFKRNEFKLLVATDVMGRGLDIPDITHVVIYDMGDVDDYVHRIGRTARGLSGLTGHALTLFEYNPKWPELAGGLAKVLEDAGQHVPPELAQIAAEVASGERATRERAPGGGKKPKWKSGDWPSEWPAGEQPSQGGAKPWQEQPWREKSWQEQSWQERPWHGDGARGRPWKAGGW
ncbi:unnamed protein product [Prorocentrum cordatum]|uniref:RNA helicase n=1 Tax=Prorocentrum cordatum TaxID=2364126 RepID=A0ABN9WZM7_9DINO|nr:unnamed protein product [Polarella glacialis]